MFLAFVRLIIGLGVVLDGGYSECGEEDMERLLEESQPVNTRNAKKSTVRKYQALRHWRMSKYKSIQPPPC